MLHRAFRNTSAFALLAFGFIAPLHASAGDALRLPLAFERNDGQSSANVKYLARGPGYRVYLGAREAVASFEGGQHVIRLEYAGASDEPRITASEPFSHRTSYFIGADPNEHVTGVASFARVRYEDVYPGIDVVYRGEGGLFEYDFVVAPGADARRIRLKLSGADAMELSDAGELVLKTRGGDVTFRKPVAFQEREGRRTPISVKYVLAGASQVSFELGVYDPRQTLVIDPILDYASFLWGAARDVTTDAQGNIYVAGFTSAADLPPAPGYQTAQKGSFDAYVLKLNRAGTQVVYATYLGARRAQTFGRSLAVDASGYAYLAGTTDSSSFPTTRGAYQRTYASGSSFVTKLNSTGTALVYSTYVTGASLNAVAVDASGSLYAVGRASQTSAFATTPGAVQPQPAGGVALRLNAPGSAAVFSTFLGGGSSDACADVAVDSGGAALITGTTYGSFPMVNAVQASRRGANDAFLAKLSPDGTTLVHSTYLGGTNKEFGTAVAVDAAGDAYVVGRSFSNDFPTTFAAFQPAKAHSDPVVSNAFVAKIPAAGGSLAYASYLGGRWCLTSGVYSCFALGSGDEGVDGATAVAVDGAGNAYVGGYANSVEFPPVDAFHGNLGPLGENERAPFVAKVSPAGDRLLYSVLLGTRGVGATLHALSVDSTGAAHAVGLGCCSQTDRFPLTAGMPVADTSNSFLARIANGRFPTTLTASASRVVSGQPVSLRAEVLHAGASGTVSFLEGDAPLGSAPVANGAAVLTLALPPGAHQIRAVHSADQVPSPPVFLLVTLP